MPESKITSEQLRIHLTNGFPWHTPEIVHPELREPDIWWNALQPIFARAFHLAGVHKELAYTLAQRVRAAYCDPRYWHLYDDTRETLKTLKQYGWQHIILSNHVPELRYLVQQLGLSDLIIALYCSAETGYEKPNPVAFQQVLNDLEQKNTVDIVWMLGDSWGADIEGAAGVGIPGILVRTTHANAQIRCSNLSEVIELLKLS